MFSRQFYPTPKNVIAMMGINPIGKTILEPSAGKGDIVNWLYKHGAKEVLTCEKNEDLAKIVQSKSQFLTHDFFDLKSEDVTHVDCIVMNPPFWCASRHIMHAYKIAPDGCKIFALMNTANFTSTMQPDSTKELLALPYQRMDLGQCFNNAQRKTDVEVSCVELKKSNSSESGFDYTLFTDEPDDLANVDGLAKYSEIVSTVNKYITSCEMYEKFHKQAIEMSRLNASLGYSSITIKVMKSNKYGHGVISHTQYMRELQRESWRNIFKRLKMERFLTTNVMKKVDAFSNNQQEIPFTVKNVYRMLEIITATAGQNMKAALVEAVNCFTRHTHENRYGVEGWKTNAGHLLNKKIIVGFMVSSDYGYPYLQYSGNRDKVMDLVKVICRLKGINYDDVKTLQETFYKHSESENPILWGKWHKWFVFEFKVFKKGTMHIKFQSKKDWELVNRAYAKAVGNKLPEKI